MEGKLVVLVLVLLIVAELLVVVLLVAVKYLVLLLLVLIVACVVETMLTTLRPVLSCTNKLRLLFDSIFMLLMSDGAVLIVLVFTIV